MPRKIKVVDLNIEDNTVENETQIDVSETPEPTENNDKVEENIEIQEEPKEPPKTDVKEDIKCDTIIKSETQPDKAVRTQELVKCNRCGRMITAKTLRYSHSQTCGVEKVRHKVGRKTNEELAQKREEEEAKKEDETNKKAIRVTSNTKTKTIPDIEEVPVKLKKQISINPTPTYFTPEMLRDYHKMMRDERIKQRDEKMKSLFSSAFK